MKIFLTGAHGTGKSTVNYELIKLKQFESYIQMDSVTSKFAKAEADFKDPAKLKKFQTEFSLYCFQKYISDINLISSRSFSDIYAYSKYQYMKYGDIRYKLISDLSIDLCRDLKDFKMIYFPIMFDLESTKLRSSNVDFQREIDSLIREFYEITKIRYHKLESIDINDRVSEILEYIGESK
jgi:hypothetical protein